MFSEGRHRLLYAGVGVGVAVATLLAPGAGAANSHLSNLVVTNPANLTEVDLSIPPVVSPVPWQDVTVALDSNCQPALNGGLTYSVTATSANPAVATVPSDASDQLQCSAPAATSATFRITAVACGTTSVTFDPVVANPKGKLPTGWQNRVGPVTVPVVVSNGGDCSNGSSGGGDTLGAAPSVANAYLNAAGTGSTVQNNCKTAGYVQKGKFFRGGLISTIAAWMPRPESIKDNTTVFPQDGSGTSWEEYVHSAVDALCGGGGVSALPPLPAGTWNNL